MELSFGSASNTERTVGQSSNPSRFIGASTGASARTNYTYGLNRSGIPATPSNFTNSYASFSGMDLRQERDIDNIRNAIITECYQ